MDIQKIKNAIFLYAEQNVMPKYNSGLMRFGAWFFLGAELTKLEQALRTQFAGILIDGDDVKWEEIKKYAELAFAKEGKLPIANITFDKSDFDVFVRIVEQG